MLKKISLFLLIVGCLCSCNPHPLKRANAKAEIDRYFKDNPRDLIGDNTFEAVIRGTDSGHNNILFRQYINAGLLQLKETKRKQDSVPVYIYEISKKGLPFLIKETASKEGYPVFTIKIFDFFVEKVNNIRYSPDKKEAAADVTLAIQQTTAFGKEAADPAFKRYLIGLFRLVDNKWELDRMELDIDRYKMGVY